MSEYLIQLTGGDSNETATLTCTSIDEQCHIRFRYRDRIIQEGSTDYFEAFCRIREKLESENLIPFCYGSSLNVYPSGMSRDMSSGMKAYRLTIGKHASPKSDLVDIFDQGMDVIPSTVARQKEYFNDWLKSKKA